MADEAPYSSSRHVVAAAVSGGADADTPVFVAPFPATVTSVQYVTPSAGTAANLVLAAGDVLNWNSLHVGSGIADPGGLVVVTYSRNDG
jgi:hypothetical protein